MLLFGAGLGVLSNVPPTLAKKLVLGRRVCLRAVAFALRLRPGGLVGEANRAAPSEGTLMSRCWPRRR